MNNTHPSSAALRDLADHLDRLEAEGIEVNPPIVSLYPKGRNVRPLFKSLNAIVDPDKDQYNFGRLGRVNIQGVNIDIYGDKVSVCRKVSTTQTVERWEPLPPLTIDSSIGSQG